MIVSKIDPLKALLYPEKGGGDKTPLISKFYFAVESKFSLQKKKKKKKKKITEQLLITSKRVKS